MRFNSPSRVERKQEGNDRQCQHQSVTKMSPICPASAIMATVHRVTTDGQSMEGIDQQRNKPQMAISRETVAWRAYP